MEAHQNEPWRQYFDEFRKRAIGVPPDAFDRAPLLYEAAHDAYQTTTDRLTAAGVDGEHALLIGRLFGAVVKDWVSRGDSDVAALEAELRARYLDWFNGLGGD